MKTEKKPSVAPPKDAAAWWVSDALSAEEKGAFWRSVMDYETAPQTTDFQQLLDAGVELPSPDMLGEAHVTVKLWQVICALAELGVFLECTNHLSDRELYVLLWRDLLRTEHPVLADGGAWHVDVLGGGTGESTHLYLKHYATDCDRQQWLADSPDCEMPPHEDPPYHRDCHLPTPYAP